MDLNELVNTAKQVFDGAKILAQATQESLFLNNAWYDAVKENINTETANRISMQVTDRMVARLAEKSGIDLSKLKDTFDNFDVDSFLNDTLKPKKKPGSDDTWNV